MSVRPKASPIGERLKGALLKEALALLTIIILGWKGLPGINILAYLAFVEKKKFYNIYIKCKCLKTYYSSLILRQNKQEPLSGPCLLFLPNI